MLSLQWHNALSLLCCITLLFRIMALHFSFSISYWSLHFLISCLKLLSVNDLSPLVVGNLPVFPSQEKEHRRYQFLCMVRKLSHLFFKSLNQGICISRCFMVLGISNIGYIIYAILKTFTVYHQYGNISTDMILYGFYHTGYFIIWYDIKDAYRYWLIFKTLVCSEMTHIDCLYRHSKYFLLHFWL